MQPRVSILLPFFNSEKTLPYAIESMLCQTFEGFELILIDCNSSDGSSSIASDFALRDMRIRIINGTSQNYAKILNYAIAESKADYLAIMDARDVSFPDRIQKQFDFLEKMTETGLVSVQIQNSVEIPSSEEFERLNQYINWTNRIISFEDISVNRFIETPLVFSTAMFRKNIIERYGGFISGDFPTDFEFILRLISKGVKMRKIPEVLYEWTYTHERFTYNSDRFFEQGLYENKSRYLFNWLKENNAFFPEVVVWGAGRNSRQNFYLLHELGINAKFYIDLRANPEHKVIQYQNTPPAGRIFILCYVSNRAAREKIRVFLVELGYIEGKDFICVA
jgi:glycosyltransferase involved in cell wall biosynthesis